MDRYFRLINFFYEFVLHSFQVFRIEGIWCELPIMVNTLPEGWRLPAILTVTSQLAQIGPFLFFAGKVLFPNHFGNVKTIYFIFFVGAASCLLLCFFWDRTFIVMNESRSILLYLFNFTLSLLGNYLAFLNIFTF